jgi:hypothetical protein
MFVDSSRRSSSSQDSLAFKELYSAAKFDELEDLLANCEDTGKGLDPQRAALIKYPLFYYFLSILLSYLDDPLIPHPTDRLAWTCRPDTQSIDWYP